MCDGLASTSTTSQIKGTPPGWRLAVMLYTFRLSTLPKPLRSEQTVMSSRKKNDRSDDISFCRTQQQQTFVLPKNWDGHSLRGSRGQPSWTASSAWLASHLKNDPSLPPPPFTYLPVYTPLPPPVPFTPLPHAYQQEITASCNIRFVSLF